MIWVAAPAQAPAQAAAQAASKRSGFFNTIVI